MTDAPPTTPADLPAPTAPARPGPTALQRTTAIVATVGLVVALLGLAVLLKPISTPTQDCGTSLGVLLDGRTDQFVSEDDPPAGITRAEAKANNDHPCRERMADAAVPAGIAIAVGLVVAVGAAIFEIVDRAFHWRRRARDRSATTPPSAPPPPTPAPSDAPV